MVLQNGGARCAAVAWAMLAVATVGAQKKPLDHGVYDSWQSIRGSDVSRDGKWLLYGKAPQVGDGLVIATSLVNARTLTIERGTAQRFSRDGKFVLSTIVPAKADVDKAKKDKKKPAEMPKNALAILSLESGLTVTIERLKALRVPEEDSGWFAYQVEPPDPKPADAKPADAKPAEVDPKKPQKRKDHAVGAEWVLREFATGREQKLADVSEFSFSKDGKTMLVAVSTKTGEGDGLFLRDVATGTTTPIMAGMANYKQAVRHDDSGAIAFLTDRDAYATDNAPYTLYVSRKGEAPKLVAKEGTAGLPSGWQPVTRGAVGFSDDGARVFFATAVKTPAEPKDKEATPDDEKVAVDIWNWKDPELQPMQLLRAAAERNRSYDAVYLLAAQKVVQLETPDLPAVVVGAKRNAPFGVGTNSLPYRQLVSWDGTYNDIYVVDVANGTRTRIVEKLDGTAQMSPGAKYISWFDPESQVYYCLATATGRIETLSKGIPHPLFNEQHDSPDRANGYGLAGWTEGDGRALIYDGFDVWSCDPTGASAPVCVTDGLGRRLDTRFRIVNTDRNRTAFAADQTLLLSAQDMGTKAAGFWSDQLGKSQTPKRLMMGDKRFGTPSKADAADVYVFTREDFGEYPDLWVSDTAFGNMRKMSDVNPQQAGYAWGSADLVQYNSLDGMPLQGILVKPADFDPMKKYPMIVYFYERMSDGLFRYYSPSPSSGASPNPAFYASRGYLVLMPDIPYKIGYPGESAVNAILPAVQTVSAMGFVDAEHMAIVGHSWGGYQTAYLITRTNMFRAAVAGAVVSNMTSAYGGIRWGTGMVRQFQYEKTQSRIGGTLWERPLQFLENSPVFWADKVQTPLLLIHNDADGAVPWYQGIEYFTALRRLQKPVWMLNYNGEDHGLLKRQNRKDWSIRMQQFFDSYLKGAPMPEWITDGVPAVDKGKNMGLGVKAGG